MCVVMSILWMEKRKKEKKKEKEKKEDSSCYQKQNSNVQSTHILTCFKCLFSLLRKIITRELLHKFMHKNLFTKPFLFSFFFVFSSSFFSLGMLEMGWGFHRISMLLQNKYYQAKMASE